LRHGFLLIPLALGLASFALSATARAECNQGCTTDGSGNTWFGQSTLPQNGGSENSAFGYQALEFNTGFQNTAVGFSALYAGFAGSLNTAVGSNTLALNAGNANTAIGVSALGGNSGSNNTASGVAALLSNAGNRNTASGSSSLRANSTGDNNTAMGFQALNDNTTGNSNIALGNLAGADLTTGNNNIDIGNPGAAGEANTIRIGRVGRQTNSYIAGISGVTVAGGVGVIVDSDGHLGTVVSSERFKDAVRPMDKASEAILSLKPVTFRYKKELDPKATPQFGLVAEQVAKVDPDLVARDAEGKPFTVRYDEVNAMLLNEFLKEYKKVEEQDAKITRLEAALKEQAAQIQKVAALVKTRDSKDRLVDNR